MARDPFRMSGEQIAMYIEGAEPGSMKHVEAKAVLTWRIAQRAHQDALSAQLWAKVAAIAAAASTVAAVAALIAHAV